MTALRTFPAMDRRYREDESLRYITRIEGEKCWRVLYVRGLRKPIQLYFTDRNYDGRDPALKAAMAFRDRVVELHAPKPGTSQRRNLRYLDKDEAQVGIGLAREHRKGRREEYYWRSAYMEGDKVVRRSWSVRTHGYEEAYRRASAFRHRMTGQKQGVCPPPPEALLAWASAEGVAL